MRRPNVLVVTLALAAACLALPAEAAVVLNLGDFENGTLNGWQQTQWSLGGEGGWAASNDPNEGWASAYPVFPPSGAWQAVGDHAAWMATAVLYRDFTVPADADSLKLRLWYYSTSMVSDMPTLEPGGQGEGMRIDVMSPAQPVLGMAGILATPFATSYPANAAQQLPPRTLRMSVVALRGQTVRLRIAAVANNGPMVVGIDDVRLENGQYQEVATTLPQLRDGAADWGDYDNDGDLDLAIMGNTGTTRVASIYRNDAGTLTRLLDLPEGYDSGDIKWLDLDRDGDLDLIVSGSPAGSIRSVRLGLNNGVGGFAFPGSASSGAYVAGNFSLADCDGDGDADVGAGYSASYPPVLYNSGAGSMGQAVVSSVVPLDSTVVHWTRSAFPGLFASGARPGAGAYPQEVFYGNVGQGASFTGSIARNLVSAGTYEVADVIGSGNEMAFLSGRLLTPSGGQLVGVLEYVSYPAYAPEDVPGLYHAAARWVDDDAHGDMDLIVSGTTEAGRYTRIHRWTPGGLVRSGDVFPQLDRAACAWGDVDGDGDPDLLLLGDGATGPVTKLYRNTVATPNLPPDALTTAPPGFTATSVTLNCVAGTDDHTPSGGLTYNFRAGTTPGTANLITPDADLVTGRRRTAREGNAANRTGYALAWSHVAAFHAPFYFAAQAVDGARCGGAWSPEAPVNFGAHVLSVSDVPADQGGQLRVQLAPGLFDSPAASPAPVSSYTIWQRVDAPAMQAALANSAAAVRARSYVPDEGAAPRATVELAGRKFLSAASAAADGFPPGTWEMLAAVPALQQPGYVARVSTVADSGVTGTHWSVYVVTTQTASPTTWWISGADSGQSVDNIAPGVPQGLAAQYHTGSGNALTWQPSADADFQYFRVYRGSAPGFAIGAGAMVANLAGTLWIDPSYDTPSVYYRLTAVDHNGNESVAAEPGQITGVGDTPALAFALSAPGPSPFSGSTRIAFALPRPGDVTLEVYDASGRRLRTLVRGPMAAGAHELAWDGRGEGGTRPAAGLLFVRLRAGGQEAVRRVVALGAAR